MVDPRRLKKWLIVVAVVYVILPRDLVPDFLGRGLGYLEDLLLIGLGAYAYRVYRRQHAARSQGQEPGDEAAGTTGAEKSSDPYEVLGVSRSATREDIQAAYRARMSEYHPDKVAHLGKELQKLAHDKALQIQQAYRQLVG